MIWFLGLAAVASCPDHVRGHVDATLIQNLLLHPYLFYALATGHNQTYPPPINKMMEMRLEKVTSP